MVSLSPIVPLMAEVSTGPPPKIFRAMSRTNPLYARFNLGYPVVIANAADRLSSIDKVTAMEVSDLAR